MTNEVFNTGEFFAPAPNDLVDNLMGRYYLERQKIESLAAILSDKDAHVAVDHFLNGNQRDERYRSLRNVNELFEKDGAIAHLNASYWQQALLLTDVLDVMPAKRREEWND
ncbi:MAG: restriction endonuclease subunit M, partial [Enterobacter asburiae]|nr:restriction endonuclease subunit M [Enterobacter asburiae]